MVLKISDVIAPYHVHLKVIAFFKKRGSLKVLPDIRVTKVCLKLHLLESYVTYS